MTNKVSRQRTIYLIKSGNYLKVGITNDINKRFDSYQTDNPDVELIATRKGYNMDESFLHELLKSRVHHREWMIYDEEIIQIFNEISFPSRYFKRVFEEMEYLHAYVTDHYKELYEGSSEEVFKEYIKMLFDLNKQAIKDLNVIEEREKLIEDLRATL